MMMNDGTIPHGLWAGEVLDVWVQWASTVGEILFHALWLGLLIGAVAALLVSMLRTSQPTLRYAVGTAALLLMVGMPILIARPGLSPTPNDPPASEFPAPAPPAPAPAPLLTAPPPALAPPAPVRILDRRSLETPGLATSDRTTSDRAPADGSSAWMDGIEGMVPGSWVPANRGTEAIRSMGERLEQTAPWWVLGWAVGVAFLALRVSGGFWWVRRLRASARPVPSAVRQAAVRAADRVGLASPTPVRQTPRLDAPLICGWTSPLVLLPESTVRQAPPDELEAVLAHEFAHVRRHDVAVSWLQAVVETLLFFHPAAWWLSRQVRLERERCCDDAVVASGVSALVYARALTHVAEATLRTRPAPGVALAPAASDGALLDRIRRLAHPDYAEPIRRLRLLIAITLLVCIPVLLAACASSESPNGSAPASSVTAQAPRADEDSSKLGPMEQVRDRVIILDSTFVVDGDTSVFLSVSPFDGESIHRAIPRRFHRLDSVRGLHDSLRGLHSVIRLRHDSLRAVHDSLRGIHRSIRIFRDTTGVPFDTTAFSGRFAGLDTTLTPQLEELQRRLQPFLNNMNDSLRPRLQMWSEGIAPRLRVWQDSLEPRLQVWTDSLGPRILRWEGEAGREAFFQDEELDERLRELRREQPERLREQARRLREQAERMERRAQEMEESGEAEESGEEPDDSPTDPENNNSR